MAFVLHFSPFDGRRVSSPNPKKKNPAINHSLFKEKTETSSNFTIPVFLQYVISSLMHQSLVFPKNSHRNQLYFNLQKDFQKQKLIIFFFFPLLAVLHVGHTIYPRTPIDTPRHPFTSQDTLYMVRKSFILFYMINQGFFLLRK